MAEVANVGAEVVEVVSVFGSPHSREKLLVQKDLIAMRGKFVQQAVFGRGEVNFTVAHSHPAAGEIDPQFTANDLRLSGSRQFAAGAGPGPPRHVRTRGATGQGGG